MPDSSLPTKDLQASWEANAGRWNDAIRNQAIESRKLVTDRAMLDAIAACAPRKALDLGCGEGWLTRAMAEQGIEAIGIDGSAALIALASQAGGSFMRLGYSELVGTPAAAGDGYDLIVANFALLEAELGPLLQALPSICTPQARLLIQTLHPHAAGGEYANGWRREDFAGFGGESWAPMPWYFRTLGSWIELIHASGWQLESLSEPLHPRTFRPASLLLQARRVG